MKAIRYIIFIPIIIFITVTVYSLLPISLFGLIRFSNTWLIIVFGVIVVTAFQLLPGVFTWLAAKISPSKDFAFYSITIISTIIGIIEIYGYWTNHLLPESEFDIFLKIMLTCLTIGFATSLSAGAGIEMFNEKQKSLGSIVSIGALIFNIGILLVFCLLSTKICFINPDKTYSWYSGIWHGIFVLPNWIMSWFSDELYCKAPNSTIEYSIWWWVSFIFFGLLGLGGIKRR